PPLRAPGPSSGHGGPGGRHAPKLLPIALDLRGILVGVPEGMLRPAAFVPEVDERVGNGRPLVAATSEMRPGKNLSHRPESPFEASDLALPMVQHQAILDGLQLSQNE